MINLFETFTQHHDPDGREEFSFPFILNPGEEIASAVVEVVDYTGTTVDASTDLVIETVVFALVSGVEWVVTVWISGGSMLNGEPRKYYLRCRVETDSTPLSRKADKTNVLICRQL